MSGFDTFSAFGRIDAVCRRSANPTGQQLLLRALCLLGMGDRSACMSDLRSAYEADASDPEILTALFDIDADLPIARAIVAHPRCGERSRTRAIEFCVASEPVVLHAERTPSGFNAIIAGQGSVRPRLAVDGSPLTVPDAAWSDTGHCCFIDIRYALPREACARIEVRRGQASAEVRLPPASLPGRRSPPQARSISVVVPIFGGRHATRACLQALAAQRCRRELEVVLVDDACPDPDMISEIAAFAADHGWRLLRNDVNLGFATSVNVGARSTCGEHLLLLNADAILPVDAIDRLACAVEDGTIGTAVPFSNDGGFSSFPNLRSANSVPDDAEAARIDGAVGQIGSRRPLDIPAGTAFCMMVSGACWDALGGLDLGYGRGYFEDVDLCLRAKQKGFRNVVVPDVYVRHLGGQSFGAAKRALVAENARLLVERFPDYDADWLAFVEADPLREVRAQIERSVSPSGPIRLVVGQSAWALPQATSDETGGATENGIRVLILSEGLDGTRCLRAGDGGIPQSLRFAADDTAGLERCLRQLRICDVTFADPSERLLRDVRPLIGDTVPVALVMVGRRSSLLLDARPDLLDGAVVRVLDGMGRAALGVEVEALRAPGRPRTGLPRVAALSPRPSVRAEQMARSLADRLRAQGGEVVLFGEGISRRGRSMATGKMNEDEYVAALAHRDITHVLLPDPDVPFALIESLRARCPLPAAYFDWSGGRHRAATGDLALSLAAASSVEPLETWCRGQPPSLRPSP